MKTNISFTATTTEREIKKRVDRTVTLDGEPIGPQEISLGISDMKTGQTFCLVNKKRNEKRYFRIKDKKAGYWYLEEFGQ